MAATVSFYHIVFTPVPGLRPVCKKVLAKFLT